MSRRPHLVLAVAMLGWVLAMGDFARAATPVEVGWWTSAQLAGTPIGAAALVPEGGFQVANGASGPVSVAAVRFTVPPGAEHELTVPLDPSSTPETTTVVACPTTAPWTPTDGGDLSEVPSWNCDLGRTSNAYDPATRTMSWTLGAAFVRDGVIDVILVPPASGLVFNATAGAPGDEAVTTVGTPSSTAPPPTASPSTTSGPPERPAPEPTRPSVTTPRPASPSTPAGAPPGTAPAGLPSPLPEPDPVAASTTAPIDDESPFGRILAGLVLLVAAGIALLALVAPSRIPTALVADERGARGVGRFRHARDDPPVRI